MKLVKAKSKMDASVKESELVINFNSFQFTQFPSQAFRDMNLTVYDVRVLGCIYTMVDKEENDKAMVDIDYDMKVDISLSNLMAESGLSRNKVKECLKNLQNFKYLKYTPKDIWREGKAHRHFDIVVDNPANCKAIARLKKGGKEYNIRQKQLEQQHDITEGEVTVYVTADKDKDTHETKYTGTHFKATLPDGEKKEGVLLSKEELKQLAKKTSSEQSARETDRKTSNARTKMKKKIALQQAEKRQIVEQKNYEYTGEHKCDIRNL